MVLTSFTIVNLYFQIEEPLPMNMIENNYINCLDNNYLKMPMVENSYNKLPENNYLDNNFGKNMSDVRFNKNITDMYNKGIGPDKGFNGLDLRDPVLKSPNIDMYPPHPNKYSPIGFPRNRILPMQVGFGISYVTIQLFIFIPTL